MSTREKIERLVVDHEIVLFMKGKRGAPQCGFSARVVDILDDYLEEYVTIDVLADPTLREEIKLYSNWPTIPQLYVRGKMIGGADIVTEMAQAGELAGVLGRGKADLPAPEVTVTPAAMAAFRSFWEGEGRPIVRLTIGPSFEAELDLSEERKNDVVLECESAPDETVPSLGSRSAPRGDMESSGASAGLVLVMERSTARRAGGVHIDFVEKDGTSGFKVDVPGAPPRVKQLSVGELAVMLGAGKPMLLVDVRTPEEREIASILGSILLDDELRERLEDLDRDTTLVAFCHHGMRSQRAAQHFLQMGFRDVSNVQGGIDAWSLHVDPSVPRY